LLGFANTLPELDEVSLLLPAAGWGSATGVLRGVDDAADEGRRTMGGGAAAVFALSPAGGLAASAGVDEEEEDADGRGIMTGRLD